MTRLSSPLVAPALALALAAPVVDAGAQESAPSAPVFAPELPTELPTEDDVRRVIKDWYGDDDSLRQAARAQVATWESEAVPVIVAAGRNGLWREQTGTLLLVISELAPDDCVAVLEELVQLEPHSVFDHSQMQLLSWLRGKAGELFVGRLHRALGASEVLRDTLLARAPRFSAHDQERFAECAGLYGWTSASELLERWLVHEHQAVRIAAARALSQLTGEAHAAEVAGSAFPSTDARTVIGAVEVAGMGYETITSFVDGEGAVQWAWFRRGFFGIERVHVGPAGEDSETSFAPGMWVERLLAWPQPDGSTLLVAYGSEERYGDGGRITVFTTTGEARWSVELPNDYDPITTLLTSTGKPRLVVPIEDELVAFTPAGERISPATKQIGIHDLDAHERLPGLLVTTHFGEIHRHVFGDTSAHRASPNFKTRPYANVLALLEPGLIVYAGTSRQGVPELVAIDLDGNPQWKAQLSAPVSELHRLYVPGGADHLLIIEDSGRLSIVRRDGALVDTQDLMEPPAPDAKPVTIFDAELLPLGGTHYRLDVPTYGKDYRVTLDVAALR